MRLSFTLVFTIIFISKLSAQTLETTALPSSKVSEINKENDEIVNNVLYPDINNQSANIFTNAITRLNPRKNLPQWYIEETKKLMKVYNVTNDTVDTPRYVVFKQGNEIFTKNFVTNIEYIYSEGCGLEETAIVKNISLDNTEELLGVFSVDKINKESNDTLIEIKEPKEIFLKPNKKYQVGDYVIEYTAVLCEGNFQYKGFGTTTPTYFNINLSIRNNEKEISQILLKIPHMNMLHIQNIIVADINADSIKDIIITAIVENICTYRMFYLSSIKDKKYDFVGYSTRCDCP